MITYAVVDLEATKDNLTNEQHVIQIGITFIENNKISDTLTIDIKPPVMISPNITELTGITNSQVANAPTFEDVSEYIATVLEGCVFVAHNSVFDYGLLVAEYERLNKTFPEMVCVDTIELAKILLPTQTLFGLKKLAYQYGILLNNHHNAGEDSHATALLFLELKKELATLSVETCQKIYRLLQRKQDNLAFLFEGKGSLLNDEWNVVTNQKSNVKHQTFIILSETQLTEKTYVSYREFIDESILDYLVYHGQELSIQDSRLLAKVCVYLEKSKGRHLLPLRLPQKLMQRIQNYDVTNRYYEQYIKYLKTQEKIYLTIHDFVRDYTLLKQHFDLSTINLQVLSTLDWVKQSRVALTQTFPLSNWLYHLFSLKNEKVAANHSTTIVDNAIGQIFQLLDSIRENIPPRLNGEVFPKDTEYYLGEIGKTWIDRLSVVLESIEQALDKSYRTSYSQLLDCLKYQVAFLDYVSVRIQATDFSMRYIVNFYPFSMKRWFDATVMLDFKTVVFVDEWIEHKALTTYFKVMVSQEADMPKGSYQILPNIVVVTDKNSQNWKENMIVKKIIQFCQQDHKKTVVIVPNQTVLVAIKDSGLFTIDDVSQGHLLSKYDVVVTTWKTAYAIRHQLVEIQKICVIKLPFEHPDSIQQQASKYFLPQRVTYFSNINLVTVLLDTLSILTQLPPTACVEIWDTRFIESIYAKKIADILDGIVKIVEE